METKTYEIVKLRNDSKDLMDDTVIVEYPFTIFIDDEEFITLLCSPKSLEELAIGFLFSEGFIDKKDNISNVRIDNEKGIAYVDLKDRKKLREKLHGKRTITSGCGKGTSFYNVIDSFKSKKVENTMDIHRDQVVELITDFNRKSELFLSTGGVHSCALCSKEGIIYFEEDIGRHNALDKILGRAFMDELDLSDKIVLTSGRISSEMLIKVAKRGIPTVISRAAPTSLAIDLAKELNILVIGFARGRKLNVYTNFPSLLT